MSTKRPSFKLVRYEPGRKGNSVLWRGEAPVTRLQVGKEHGPGRYVMFIHGPGIRGMKPYDRFVISEMGAPEDIRELRVFDAETVPPSNRTHSTMSDLSDSQLFDALDRTLDADVAPEQMPAAKHRIRGIVEELKSRGTTKERWEGYAADKGGDKLLYMLGGVLAGGALGAIAMAYYYSGKIKDMEAEMSAMKNELYQVSQAMNAPQNPDLVLLRRFNSQHGGTP